MTTRIHDFQTRATPSVGCTYLSSNDSIDPLNYTKNSDRSIEFLGSDQWESSSFIDRHGGSHPVIPLSLIVEHVLPFLDRDTYDNCIIANNELLETSRVVSTPPWPTKRIDMKVELCSVAFAPVGCLIACGCEDGTVRLLGIYGNVDILKGHRFEVTTVAFSPDGTTLVSSGRDCTIRVWNIQNSEFDCIEILKGHPTPVHSIAFFPDGKVFAACGYDEVVRLWSLPTASCIARIPHRENLESVAISPNGKNLASATWDGCIRIWEVCENKKIGSEKVLGKGLPSTTINFSPDGNSLFGFKGFRVRKWNIDDGSCSILTGHRVERVCSVAMSPDAQTIAYGESDGVIQISTVSSAICRATLKATNKAHTGKCRFAFSPSGRTLASVGDHTLWIWDA